MTRSIFYYWKQNAFLEAKIKEIKLKKELENLKKAKK